MKELFARNGALLTATTATEIDDGRIWCELIIDTLLAGSTPSTGIAETMSALENLGFTTVEETDCLP